MILVSCDSFGFIFRIAGYLFGLLQWGVPIFLICLITFDVLKGMIGGDEKKSKEALGRAGKRLMYAIIIFFIPILVKILFKAVDRAGISGYSGDNNSATSWISCFNQYFK